MPQQPIELILIRQWASYVSLPVWVMDMHGDLIYYNEPAGVLLGREYDQVETISSAEVETLFHTKRLDGSPFENHELPIVVAVHEQKPCHARLLYTGLDKMTRVVDITALPIQRPGGEMLGAIAIFWETPAG